MRLGSYARLLYGLAHAGAHAGLVDAASLDGEAIVQRGYGVVVRHATEQPTDRVDRIRFRGTILRLGPCPLFLACLAA